MTKWNHGASYSISRLSEEELAEAIDEWAEGSEALKELLTLCYEKGVNTFGCHFGKGSYIDFEGTDNLDALKRMCRGVSGHDGLQLLGSSEPTNPYTILTTGLRSTFSIGDRKGQDRHASNIFFNKVSLGLLCDGPENEAFDRLVDYYSFFAGKEPGFHFRIRQSKEDGYRFSIETSENVFGLAYSNAIFERAGFKRVIPYDDAPLVEWVIESRDKAEFDRMMTDSFSVVENEWQLEMPTVIEDNMSFPMKTRIAMRELVKKPDGIKAFMKWFIENSPDSFWELHREKRPTWEEFEKIWDEKVAKGEER